MGDVGRLSKNEPWKNETDWRDIQIYYFIYILAWHRKYKNSMQLPFHWYLIVLLYTSSLASSLFTTQSVNEQWVSDSATSGSGRSRVWQRTRRTREKNQVGSFLLKICSFKLIRSQTTHHYSQGASIVAWVCCGTMDIAPNTVTNAWAANLPQRLVRALCMSNCVQVLLLEASALRTSCSSPVHVGIVWILSCSVSFVRLSSS